MGNRSSRQGEEQQHPPQKKKKAEANGFPSSSARTESQTKSSSAQALPKKKTFAAPVAAPGSAAALAAQTGKPIQQIVGAVAKGKASAKPKATASKSGANSKDQAEEGDLPKGEGGAKWEALEDGCWIREGREIKSQKLGQVPKGKDCVQTGAWRVDPSGLVRMPMKRDGVHGWVTIDARKCRNADGGFGSLCFMMLQDKEEEVNEDEGQAQHDTSTPGVDPDAWLDELVQDSSDEETKAAPPAAPVKEIKASVNAKQISSKKPDAAAAPARESEPNQEAPPTKNEGLALEGDKVELSEAARVLRALKKKVRDIEALEAKLKETGQEPTSDQQLKLRTKADLKKKIRKGEEVVARENKDEATQAFEKESEGARKRPKKPNRVSGIKNESAPGDAKTGSRGGVRGWIADIADDMLEKWRDTGWYVAMFFLVIALGFLICGCVKIWPTKSFQDGQTEVVYGSAILPVALVGHFYPGRFLIMTLLGFFLALYSYG